MWTIEEILITHFRHRYDFNFVHSSIRNVHDIEDACRFIFITKHVLFQGRTPINPQRWSLGNNHQALVERDTLLASLAERIWQYFNLEGNTPNNQEEFDCFHEELCDWFLNGLNGIRHIVGFPDASYGNAQKMINVLFKYLSCFSDYLLFADFFSYCHMPIDRYILGDLIRYGVPNVLQIPREKQYVYRGIPQCWHELDKEHYFALLGEYRRTLALIKPATLSFLSLEFCLFSHLPFPQAGEVAPTIKEFHR